MDEAEAKVAVSQLLTELHEARETLEDSQRRITGVRKLIEGYIELFPLLEELVEEGDLGDEEEGPRPRGQDAALRVLKDRAGKWYQVPVIVAMLDKQGWMPRSSNPRNAVRAALERLVENGEIEKGNALEGGMVIYSYPEPEPDPDESFGEEPF